MKALESFEIQSWNALWVFKYKIHRQQISVHCNTTIHDKAENLKIQHINSYLFLRTATYNSLANSLSRVTFDLIPCPEQWNVNSITLSKVTFTQEHCDDSSSENFWRTNFMLVCKHQNERKDNGSNPNINVGPFVNQNMF